VEGDNEHMGRCPGWGGRCHGHGKRCVHPGCDGGGVLSYVEGGMIDQRRADAIGVLLMLPVGYAVLVMFLCL